jgi:two-component system chemotaxis response regulator CheB
MVPIRVLVIDDSVVVRKALSQIIAQDPQLELAGTAATAPIGIQKIEQCNPDVVIMDVEMPEMTGIEATSIIRRTWARLPILMCSTLTERGADVTLRALASGASDYIAKPSAMNTGGEVSVEMFRLDFLAKVKALAGRAQLLAQLAMPAPTPAAPVVPLAARRRVGSDVPSVLLVGSSTGGPNALATVFADLPGDLPVPIFIVQHMPPLFTRMLAERLTATTRVRVVEAQHGDLVEPGRGYVAPGNFHMTVVRDGTKVRIALNQDPPENSCRPAVDVMFRSAAKLYGGGCVAAVLTGMGQDGTRGARDIAEAGGWVAVQDAASCVVPSMPGAVVQAGLANEVVTLDRMGSYLAAKVSRSRFQATARTA